MLNLLNKKAFKLWISTIVKKGENPMLQNVQPQSEKFDGLAGDYDRSCYPLALLKTMFLPFKNKKHLSIVDVGAGTRHYMRGDC